MQKFNCALSLHKPFVWKFIELYIYTSIHWCLANINHVFHINRSNLKLILYKVNVIK